MTLAPPQTRLRPRPALLGSLVGAVGEKTDFKGERMSFKAKAIAGVAAAASLAASGTVIATTTQSSHSLPEAQKASQKQSLGEGDGWVESAIATQDAQNHDNEEEIDLGNLQPRSKGEGSDHGNERSQAARPNARDKEGRGDEEGNERNDNEKVTLCHRTGSAKNPGVTITVSVNALKAHEAHGDEQEPCNGSVSGRARGQRDARTENRGAGRGKSSAKGAVRGHQGPPKDKAGR